MKRLSCSLLLASLPLLAEGELPKAHVARIDEVMAAAIEAKEIPGAVLVVGRSGKIVLEKAYGSRALVPAQEPMTLDTVFDLASLTKPLATAASILALVEEGRLRLQDRVVTILPEFGKGGGLRDKVTVEDLLVHRAGLLPDDPMRFYVGTPAEIFARKHAQPLTGRPGEKFVYSDAGFEVLAEIVRAVSGKPLDVYSRERIFEPLEMKETGFLPLAGKGAIPISRIAPTEVENGVPFRGVVHDPRARALGGVAGHAGLFSTARDLARYAAFLLGDAKGPLSPATIAELTRPRVYGDLDVRALGWDVSTSFSTSRGDLFPPGSFGHTGWTGTSMWLDPETRTFVILLSNRNHPDESGNAQPVRSRIATIVASALGGDPMKLRKAGERLADKVLRAARPEAGSSPFVPPPAPAEVLSGLDVLEASGFAALAGKRIAVLTNQTGLTRDGRALVDVLLGKAARDKGIALVKLFSPEHGIAGVLDEKVGDGVHPSGLPIRSLYGESRRPAKDDFAGLDAVVVDLQDAGCRFYTYLTTMGYVLETAALAKVEVVVLDRPNPINAVSVEGPMAETNELSFVAYHPIPIRTGMTIGELAKLFNGERKIGADLTVVPLQGYRRALWYDETGLPWTNPSPNLRTVTQAALYPGVALLEFTNVSVGRGTESPFEIFGAPWLDAKTLVRTLRARAIPGVAFTEVTFTPQSSTFAKEVCRGVRISVTNRSALQPVALGFEILTALRDQHPKEWDRTRVGRLIANTAVIRRLDRGEPAGALSAAASPAVMGFELTREKYLIYR